MPIETFDELFISEKKPEDVAYQWCVYFDDDTEEVITVTNRPRKEIQYPYVLTTSIDARDILKGVLNPKKYLSLIHI